jgi:hypothetical protein
MPKLRILIGILVVTLLLGQRSQITAQKKFALTIDNIMRGPELYGNEPTALVRRRAACLFSMEAGK